MAIAFDAYTGASGTGTSLTTAHTVTGSNTILFVGTFYQVNESVSSITYNGAAMTFIARQTQESDTRNIELWYLINPATGAHNVVTTGSASSYRENHISSYTGAKQSSQPDSSASPTASSTTTFNMSTTVVASNCWLLAFARNDSVNYSAGTGTTLRDGSLLSPALCDSNGTVGTGAQTLQLTTGSSGNHIGIIVSIAPPATGPAGIKTWDGITQSTGIKTYKDVTLASTKSVNGIT